MNCGKCGKTSFFQAGQLRDENMSFILVRTTGIELNGTISPMGGNSIMKQHLF